MEFILFMMLAFMPSIPILYLMGLESGLITTDENKKPKT